MKHCTVVYVFVCLLGSFTHAFSGLKRLRVSQSASHSNKKRTSSPIRDSLWAHLHEFKWTVFLGDSVLGAQFLTLAQELGATPDEPSLSQHDHCTEKDGAWPTHQAMMALMDKPIEYLLLCGPNSCTFSRLGCMNFYASVCTDKDDSVCVSGCEGTQVWDQMTQKIMQTISQTEHFAVSFHWAPSYFPHANVYDRLGKFVPGALLWNNCHHWIGHAQEVGEPTKLNLWLSYVDSSAAVLEKFIGLQSLAYQGCSKVLCEGGVRDSQGHSQDWIQKCHGRKEWLEKANGAAQNVITGRGMHFVDLNMLLPDEVVAAAFLDGDHPCMPIPCMWQNSEVHPPRQCCQSLLVHSLQSLGGLAGSSGGTWDVPTLVNTSGVARELHNGSKRLLEDVIGVWDEARPKEVSRVNQSQHRAYI